MTHAQIENAIHDLNTLVLAGKLMDAFEKYYHDDVVMQENNLTPTVSKKTNRQREIQFLENVTEFRSAEVKNIGIGIEVSFVVWKYDYSHKEWGLRDYTQVSIQEWQDGKIIKETFVYAN
jgi:hypothetical protein